MKKSTQIDTLNDRLQLLIEKTEKGKHTVFARKAGIPKATFQNYIKGRNPNVEHLVRISETFDANLDWLLTGQGEMFHSSQRKNQNNKLEVINDNNSGIIYGNNNHVHILMDKKAREDDQSLDAFAMLTKILASGNQTLINIAINQLNTLVQEAERTKKK